MDETNSKLLLALSFLTLSENYLILTKNILLENIKFGNKHMVVSNKKIDHKEYHNQTKWSDFNIVIPTLFNFYHGLELLMKGLLLTIDSKIMPEHGLIGLLEQTKSKALISSELNKTLEKHIDKTKMIFKDLAVFLQENKLSIDNLYESLRYPTDKSFDKIFDYYELKYKEGAFLGYSNEIISDIDVLMAEATKFYRDRELELANSKQ